MKKVSAEESKLATCHSSMHKRAFLQERHLENSVLDVAAQCVYDTSVVGNKEQIVADCHCTAADAGSGACYTSYRLT